MTTKSNPKAVWLKELHAGQEGSAWRGGGEIIDQEMQSARKLLDKAGLFYMARDLIRLTEVLFKALATPSGIVALAKARLDCEGIPYVAADLVEMIALLIECMDCMADVMAEQDAEHMEDCVDCAGQVRH